MGEIKYKRGKNPNSNKGRFKKGHKINFGKKKGTMPIWWREKISKGNKGKKRTKEVIERMRRISKRRKFSEETREKLSEALKGNKNGRGNKGKLGKRLSEEHKRKIGDANKGKPKSEEMKKKLSKSISGKNHWNYKGGITPIWFKERSNPLLREWKKTILRIYNFTCQKCSQSGGRLVVHHINNFADFIEVRTAIDNGIVFCQECHLEFHKKYGRRNNTKEQLGEFLNQQKILWE